MFIGQGNLTRDPVHPRTCGEHFDGSHPRHGYSGSSPHVRGTSIKSNAALPSPRFIPARAGNMGPGRRDPAEIAVHPRTCGEHRSGPGENGRSNGSSPHVRGTFRRLRFPPDVQRFIPARAGNMALTVSSVSKLSVHPRTCGEHYSLCVLSRTIPGSSPHVRGTSNTNALSNVTKSPDFVL